jgi:hypothetical protein
MEDFIKDFITAFAESKNIQVEQLVSIELGQKIKYVYLDGNSFHLVEEMIQYGDSATTSE